MTQPHQPAADDAGINQTPRSVIDAARDLLARTVDLPRSKRQLVAVLSEYRAALFDLAAEGDKH